MPASTACIVFFAGRSARQMMIAYDGTGGAWLNVRLSAMNREAGPTLRSPWSGILWQWGPPYLLPIFDDANSIHIDLCPGRHHIRPKPRNVCASRLPHNTRRRNRRFEKQGNIDEAASLYLQQQAQRNLRTIFVLPCSHCAFRNLDRPVRR